MIWKYIVISVAKIAERQINIQFEVAAESISYAEQTAKATMELKGIEIDVIEIRRI